MHGFALCTADKQACYISTNIIPHYSPWIRVPTEKLRETVVQLDKKFPTIYVTPPVPCLISNSPQ